jgi:chaperonin cofactor prefoldin
VQVSGLTTQITGLESQNEVLDQRIQELTNTISHLDVEIANTKSELALTQTNNAYLQNELQAQMAQRADLEHKFNDLSEVKAQVSKLKNELFIARRVELQNENAGKKGGEMLMARTPPSTNSPAKSPARYDLNVEIGSDGSVRVIPPLGPTNSAAH